MTVGGEMLISKYGNPLAIAEALLEGKLANFEVKFVEEVVSRFILDAARIKIELRTSNTNTKTDITKEEKR